MNPVFFNSIFRQISMLHPYTLRGCLELPKLIAREKMPSEYTLEDYDNDSKVLTNFSKHPYIINKMINGSENKELD